VDEDSDTSERTPPFLSSFVTPLLKATKKGKKGEVLSFYSLPEYQAWRDQIADDAKKWNVKYYKGLGTSTTREAKEYFASFDNHYRPFYWSSDNDGELLDMVFDKGRASERKEWIQDTHVESVNVAVDPAKDRRLSYEDFVNQELIQFSRADITRSIPSLIDGLKPSQRKVLYACFKRNLKSEIKVAQLTGYCAEHTAYHHGCTANGDIVSNQPLLTIRDVQS
jgi:DNA topoisomerase II